MGVVTKVLIIAKRLELESVRICFLLDAAKRPQVLGQRRRGRAPLLREVFGGGVIISLGALCARWVAEGQLLAVLHEIRQQLLLEELEAKPRHHFVAELDVEDLLPRQSRVLEEEIVSQPPDVLLPLHA